MKDKIIKFNSCVSIFQPNLQRSFATISPINIIDGPTSTLFYSWTGSISYTSTPSIAFGTVDRWRHDPNDVLQLNRDQWVLWSTGTANLIRLKETEKTKISDHWSKRLPSDVYRDSPLWVRNLIDNVNNNK